MRWPMHGSDRVLFHRLACQSYRLALPDLDQSAPKGLYVIEIDTVSRVANVLHNGWLNRWCESERFCKCVAIAKTAN